MAFMILFLLLIRLSSILVTVNAQPRNSTISLGSSLSPARNLFWLLESGQFAFGFYPYGNAFSVGIWFENIQQKTVVWTANRDEPPFPADAILLLSTDGRLVVQPKEGQQIVIANPSQSAASASMLDSGNFVLFNSSSAIIWQSFDFPTDTILPGQRLVPPHQLVSSVSHTNHTKGNFFITMQTDGNLVQYPVDESNPTTAYWQTETDGAGNGVSLNFDSHGQLYLLNANGSIIKNIWDKVTELYKAAHRATIDADGIFRLYSHSLNRSDNWSIEWLSTDDKCRPTGLCSVNSYCDLISNDPVCQCVSGYDYIDKGQKNSGCSRNFSVHACGTEGETNFDVHELPDVAWYYMDAYSTLSSIEKNACRDECSRDCNCEAAFYENQYCMKLRLPLRSGRKKSSGTATTFLKIGIEGGKRKRRELRMVIFITTITCLTLAFLVLVGVGILLHRSRIRENKRILNVGNDGFVEDVTLRSFSYEELKDASNNFTDEIGKGSCGTVFKGVLSNGNRIMAIKRLEKVLAEGEREFKNEMRIIGKTHHRNLVQLLGYCHQGADMFLVYEHMSHGSLADFFFRARLKTDWEGRTEIALDIARGILYLHEECETQIIHCDIKPENILMDEKGCAKIADFGLAKLLMPNQTKTFTGIRGTRGYVAPEWWHQNSPITVKADVYSFGIMFLEIICCRRSVDMNAPEDEVVLPYWVYDCFMAGQLAKLVKEEEVEMNKLERMVKVGLWCIQDDPSSRPSMKKVILMLEGTVEIPAPPSRPSSFTTSS